MFEFRNAFETSVTRPELASVSALFRRASSELSTTDGTASRTLGLESAELKAAFDNASTITVKMHQPGSNDADVLVKRDGTIEQFLNLSSDEDRNLVIAIEAGSTGEDPLTMPQLKMLQQLRRYMNARSVPFGPSTDTTESGTTTCDTTTTANTIPDTTADTTTTANTIPDITADTTTAPDTSTTADTATDTASNYDAPPQFDLFDFLMQLFEADEETFRKLMPGLYRKITGANGKIDPSKLRRLVDSKDPELNSLKRVDPRFMDVVSRDEKSDNTGKKTSGDAVNQTGAVLAEKAAQVSQELNSTGYCAKGVSFAIERATGKVIWGNANDMRNSLPEQGFSVSNNKDLKVGQVVHVYWTPEVYAQEQARRGPCPNYGDIAIIGKGRDGQLYAYNDFATPLNDYLQKSRYDWSTLKVFTPNA